MSDKILLENVKLQMHIGAKPSERKKRQPIQLDIRIGFDTRKAAKTEKLSDTLNYEAAYYRIKEMADKEEFILLETICERIADVVFDMGGESVKIKAVKLESCIQDFDGIVGVEIERYKNTAE